MRARDEQLPYDLRERAFSVGEAVSKGISRWRIDDSDLERPFHGVRTPKEHQPVLENRYIYREKLIFRYCRGYGPMLAQGRFFSHQTAAIIWGIPLPLQVSNEKTTEGRPILHVSSLAPQNRPRGAGIVGHRAQPVQMTPMLHRGLRVSGPVDTWLALASLTQVHNGRKVPLLSIPDLVAAGDYLIQVPVIAASPIDRSRPFATIEELAARVHNFRGKGKQRLKKALPLVRMGSESRMESLLRLKIIDSGLPEPELNREITDASGTFIGRADLVYPEFRVIVEYDGDQHRTDLEQYRKDVKRLWQFTKAGWQVIRVLYDGVFTDFNETRANIEHALRAAGWSASAPIIPNAAASSRPASAR